MSLWPALGPAVAAHGLEGATLALPEVPVEPPVWAQLIAVAKHERIAGLLMRAILDGALPTTAEQTEEAGVAHRAAMVTALALEATLVETAALLEERASTIGFSKVPVSHTSITQIPRFGHSATSTCWSAPPSSTMP